MVRIAMADMDTENINTLVVTAKGDYCLTIAFYAESHVLRGITENMKRGATASDTDIEIYTTEYFNILCGHVITNVNKAAHTSARFGIPKMVKGCYMDDTPFGAQIRQELFYDCGFGPVKLETLYQSS